ncbi:hypothetical protein WJ968_23420 [Achromobacter xylosoxidans]
MERLIYRKTAFLLFTSLASASSLAAQNSTTFNVSIIIQANCTIAATNLTFLPRAC